MIRSNKKIRAKFSCWEVKTDEYGEHIHLEAVYGKDEKDNEENNQFAESTPTGRLDMQISNPGAMGFFEEGGEYYLDFTKANQ